MLNQNELVDNFNKIINTIIKNEGGFINDKDDSGGKTKYGISQKAFPDVDIENLDLEDAIHIYKKEYWDKYKIELIPKHLQRTYFDMVVNHGYTRATKILQEAHNSHSSNKLDIDGVCGRLTRKAVCTLRKERLQAYRVFFYVELVLSKPKLEKFYYGWFKRGIET